MHKINIKSFPLIEIISVITIISVALLIITPIIKNSILNHKKTGYISIAKEFVERLKDKENLNLTTLLSKEFPIYYNLDKIIESKDQSPFGNRLNNSSYIMIEYSKNEDKYIYSICLVDEKGNGIGEIDSSPINIEKVNISNVQINNAKCNKAENDNKQVIGSSKDWQISSEINNSGGYTLLKFKGNIEDCANIKVDKNYYNENNISLNYLYLFNNEDINNTNKNAYKVTIPNIVDDKKITEIGADLFLPYNQDNKTLIESYLRIIKITVPTGITNIEGYNEDKVEYGPFMFDFNLSEVELPSTLKLIGNNAFSFTKLTSIKIPSSVETINSNAFKNGILISVNFQGIITENSHLTIIGKSAFENNIINSLNIPSSVETIEKYAFRNNNINSLNFSGTSTDGNGNDNTKITTIEEEAFSHNSIVSSIYLPSSLKNIGILAFGYSKCPCPTVYLNQKKIPQNFITNLDKYDNSWNSDWSCKDKHDVYILGNTSGYIKSN